jgi:bacterioferritin-associated ferredoxin
MFICICNGFTDRQIQVAVRQGEAHSVSDMYRCLGCRPQCGRCAPTVLKIMREPSADEAALQAVVANTDPAGVPVVRFGDAAE